MSVHLLAAVPPAPWIAQPTIEPPPVPAASAGAPLVSLGAAVLETADSIATLSPQGKVEDYSAAFARVQALAVRIATSDAGLAERGQWASDLTTAIQGQIDQQTTLPPGPQRSERLDLLHGMRALAQASGEPPRPQAPPQPCEGWGDPYRE